MLRCLLGVYGWSGCAGWFRRGVRRQYRYRELRVLNSGEVVTGVCCQHDMTVVVVERKVWSGGRARRGLWVGVKSESNEPPKTVRALLPARFSTPAPSPVQVLPPRASTTTTLLIDLDSREGLVGRRSTPHSSSGRCVSASTAVLRYRLTRAVSVHRDSQ